MVLYRPLFLSVALKVAHVQDLAGAYQENSGEVGDCADRDAASAT
jgi:hypothetical protein